MYAKVSPIDFLGSDLNYALKSKSVHPDVESFRHDNDIDIDDGSLCSGRSAAR